MDAALTTDEITALSDPDRILALSTRLVQASQSSNPTSNPFEESLRLKNTLDLFEEQSRLKPNWEKLSVLLNCEFLLWKLNEETETRLNPFLSHWVEAVLRFENTNKEEKYTGEGNLGRHELERVRCELVKGLLKRGGDVDVFGQMGPREISRRVVEGRQRTDLDMRTYIRMLEEEGIYERVEATKEDREATVEIAQPTGSSKGKEAVDAPNANGTKKRWNEALLDRLEVEPDVAITEIVHLPIELASLDFLTTLLERQTLQRLSIDPSPVITGYVQHALRLAEKMGQPTSPESQYSASMNGLASSDDGLGDHGRAAQSRAIKLLLLFIRNLIRKALLPPDALYFEIQEICVRYVWIKEVREFKAFVEGTLGEGGFV